MISAVQDGQQQPVLGTAFTRRVEGKAGVMPLAHAERQQPLLGTAATCRQPAGQQKPILSAAANCRMEEEDWSDVTGSLLYLALQPTKERRRKAATMLSPVQDGQQQPVLDTAST